MTDNDPGTLPYWCIQDGATTHGKLTDDNAFVTKRSLRQYSSIHVLYATPWMEQLCAEPDKFIDDFTESVLKQDKSSTVVVVGIDGRQIVIKRYNPRSIFYACKRALRASRAAQCLQAALWLQQAQIQTPRPVGYIEQRLGPLHGKAYFLTEFVQGDLLSDIFQAQTALSEDQTKIIAAVAGLFQRLKSNSLVHGDMKATNLMWNKNRLVTLDLDATRKISSAERHQALLRNDQSRFLRNFDQQLQLKREVEALLDK